MIAKLLAGQRKDGGLPGHTAGIVKGLERRHAQREVPAAEVLLDPRARMEPAPLVRLDPNAPVRP